MTVDVVMEGKAKNAKQSQSWTLKQCKKTQTATATILNASRQNGQSILNSNTEKREQGTESKNTIETTNDITSKLFPKKNTKSMYKRQSPFRIKTGTLVVLRYHHHQQQQQQQHHHDHFVQGQSNQTNLSLPLVDTWVDPIPGYHQGMILIGCRVRCCFPKAVLSDSSVTNRIVEGDIIGLVDHQRNAALLTHAFRNRYSTFIPVDLLIDQYSLQPFLTCVDKDIDQTMMSDKERKKYRYEQIIRGKDKVTVRVHLGISFGPKQSLDNIHDSAPLVCKWVIRERVTVLRGTGEQQVGEAKQDLLKDQFVGDKFDSQGQQKQNWRWMARRLKLDPTFQHFVGQVVSLRQSTKSLAIATVKVMCMPESTPRGRLAHHYPLELFHADSASEVELPIEQLIAVSHKVQDKAMLESGFAMSSKVYSQTRNSWVEKSRSERAGKDDEILVCHRCGIEGIEMMIDAMAVTPSAISCSDCIKSTSKFGRSGTFLKSCRCQLCTNHHAVLLSEAFSQCNSRIETEIANPLVCSVCCLRCKTGVSCDSCGILMHKGCAKWVQKVDVGCPVEKCLQCRYCKPIEQGPDDARSLAFALAQVKHMRITDFDLPPSFGMLHTVYASFNQQIVGGESNKKTKRKMMQTTSIRDDVTPRKRKRILNMPSETITGRDSVEDPITKNDSCLRLHAYDPIRRGFEGVAKHKAEVARTHREVARNLRSAPTTKMEEKKTSVRAARASQRRIMKDFAKLGSSLLELDSLKGRESCLRFDRSGIHAWGVFADQDIREGEMIVEYRGEIIGNAVAEKRELEYLHAKIGSDYMFRIDTNSVCDATKRGNVARYLNASCDPNCYTQIISINNTKRIVIYAKKNITAGLELCYDYKFPVEFDESKRIECYCGANDCRGFMNWDKRYVAIPANLQKNDEAALPQAALNCPENVASSAAGTPPNQAS